MPKLTEARSRLRRDQIVEAARRCFVRNGMERTSVADITAESGLSAGSIYAHYSSKAEIVLAVVQDVMDRRAAILAAYATGTRPPSPAQVIAHLAAATERDDARVALQAWGEATTDPAIHDVVVAMIDRIRGLFRDSCAQWLVTTKDLAPSDAGPRAERLADQLVAAYQAHLVRAALGAPAAIDDAAIDAIS
ncbi:DNA-binding transcriptional regulator, AcrR family [Asanoa hainanensis]|uniref:DNA-binding transcriptional regulator, AcrR family n=1 Tax=Asanoa hainanensis TaxID=560556 RepID=A0A239P237_9ACTN|nr:TetR/AcrR family transcriptional regulator [Asanoa hainanensis]SNT60698.1 DNA-binding transcriptional regulator, AcrR family [Asanoa hainanensis]